MSGRQTRTSPFAKHTTYTLSSEVVIEPLECVTDEGQAHLGRFLQLLARRKRLRLEHRRIIRLVNFIRGEVRGINGRREARFKWRTDTTQAIELDTSEEGVALDFVRTASAETCLRVADETRVGGGGLVDVIQNKVRAGLLLDVPSNEMLCLGAQRDVVREVEGLSPVHDLSVRVVAVFGAEGRPAHKTFEHDGTQGPPVAVECVAVTGEDLGGDIVRRSDRRVRHQSSRASPVVNLSAVADCQVNLVNSNRVAVPRPVGPPLQ